MTGREVVKKMEQLNTALEQSMVDSIFVLNNETARILDEIHAV